MFLSGFPLALRHYLLNGEEHVHSSVSKVEVEESVYHLAFTHWCSQQTFVVCARY